MSKYTENNTLSVKEFADATGRFPNQIYDLINKGNQYRKLDAILIEGRKRIPITELTEFPFNAADKLRIELASKLDNLEKRIDALENPHRLSDWDK